MTSESTPRISAKYLEQFMNRTVRILGKVTALHGETASLDASGSINLHLNRDAHLETGHSFEVVGKVQNDLSVRVYQATDFGMGIDPNAVEALVDATHRYKEIFYDEN